MLGGRTKPLRDLSTVNEIALFRNRIDVRQWFYALSVHSTPCFSPARLECSRDDLLCYDTVDIRQPEVALQLCRSGSYPRAATLATRKSNHTQRHRHQSILNPPCSSRFSFRPPDIAAIAIGEPVVDHLAQPE